MKTVTLTIQEYNYIQKKRTEEYQVRTHSPYYLLIVCGGVFFTARYCDNS